MWMRAVGAVLIVSGTLATAYLEWARYRFSAAVLMKDRAWPRPWPYPDEWLLRYERRLNAADPAPPGTVKLEGEIETVREHLADWVNVSFAAAVVGAAPWAVWLRWRLKNRRATQDMMDYAEGGAAQHDRPADNH
jgi:hypothetical protein